MCGGQWSMVQVYITYYLLYDNFLEFSKKILQSLD